MNLISRFAWDVLLVEWLLEVSQQENYANKLRVMLPISTSICVVLALHVFFLYCGPSYFLQKKSTLDMFHTMLNQMELSRLSCVAAVTNLIFVMPTFLHLLHLILSPSFCIQRINFITVVNIISSKPLPASIGLTNP